MSGLPLSVYEREQIFATVLRWMGYAVRRKMTTSRTTISLNIVACNERDETIRLISQLNDVDEVIVLDLASDDDVVRLHGTSVNGSPLIKVFTIPRVPVAESIRHHGYEASTSEWILVADPDESYPTDFVGHLREYLERTDAVMMAVEVNTNAFGPVVDFGKFRPTVNRIYRRTSLLSSLLTSEFAQGHIHSMPKNIGKREVFAAAGPIVNGQGTMTLEGVYRKLTRYAGSERVHLFQNERHLRLSMIGQIFVKAFVRNRLHHQPPNAMPLYWLEFLHDLTLYTRAVEYNGGLKTHHLSIRMRAFLWVSFETDRLLHRMISAIKS